MDPIAIVSEVRRSARGVFLFSDCGLADLLRKSKSQNRHHRIGNRNKTNKQAKGKKDNVIAAKRSEERQAKHGKKTGRGEPLPKATGERIAFQTPTQRKKRKRERETGKGKEENPGLMVRKGTKKQAKRKRKNKKKTKAHFFSFLFHSFLYFFLLFISSLVACFF